MPALPAGLPGWHVQRLHAALPVHPDHAVFGQAELVLLLEVDECRHAGGKREDGEDCGR